MVLNSRERQKRAALGGVERKLSDDFKPMAVWLEGGNYGGKELR